MIDDNTIRHGKSCVFKVHAHLVFVTKYRQGVFTKTILDDLREIFSSVCQDFEAQLVEFNGEDEHVHLLVNAGSCGGAPLEIIQQYIEKQHTPQF